MPTMHLLLTKQIRRPLKRHVPTTILTALLLAGCASEVVRAPVDLEAAAVTTQRYVATQRVAFRLDSGYERTITEGSEFVRVGRVRQGIVLKPTRTVMTVEGAHMHEAWLVVERDRLVGFYLPVEHAFSPLSAVVVVPFQPREASP